MNVFDHLIIIAYAILYPAYDFFYTAPEFKKNAAGNKPDLRIREYRAGALWIWIFSILVITVWLYNERALANLGLDISAGWQIWLSLFLLFIGTGYIFYILYLVKNNTEQRNYIQTKLKTQEITIYLPRNRNEFTWFILLSVSAGICEELLYRGYLMWYLREFSSTGLAVILSSVLFGLAHSYQGIKGVLRSGVTGLVLAIIYLFTSSLWIPIVLHIIVDVYSGLLGWLAFDEENRIIVNAS